MMQSRELGFRPADRNDTGQIARLFAQLGHHVPASTIEERWDLCTADKNGMSVAEAEGGRLVGLVTFGFFHVIHRDNPVGRILALVVDSEFRQRGIGRRLLAMAEKQLIKGGCCRLEIISNHRYGDAHRFYEHLGYASTGVRLQKDL